MLYTIYIISSNFPHIFRSLFQLVCFYPHLPCQTTITKEKKIISGCAEMAWKQKKKITKTEKSESTHYFHMPFPQLQHPSLIPFADGWKSNLKEVNPTGHSDWIFCSQAYHFCQNTGVFNMAAFSLPLFSTVSSLKLRKWYMLLCNNKNTLYKKRIMKMAVSSNL